MKCESTLRRSFSYVQIKIVQFRYRDSYSALPAAPRNWRLLLAVARSGVCLKRGTTDGCDAGTAELIIDSIFLSIRMIRIPFCGNFK